MVNLSKRIRQLRLENGLSAEYISHLLYVSRQAYSNYENGIRQIPHESLLILADYYSVSLDYLYGRTSNGLLVSHLEKMEQLLLCKFHTLDPPMKLLLIQIMEYLSERIQNGTHE
ncbi:MAG: helix-turn-helix domain-containing protein [Lachnospiraceae bacterium]|nr:helix-turn-helix transcriptional regulator [Candidatus Fimimorpha excrementavium]